MSEYIVDLESAVTKATEELTATEAFLALSGLPVLERITRCKDCKYYSDHEWIIATDVSDVCHFWHRKATKVEPDGFCAWSERRDA